MKRKILVSAVVFLSVIGCGILYQIGPPWRSTDTVLGAMTLSSTDRLSVVAHYTGNFFEPYEVSLYRVRCETNISVCFLAGEDAYWWACHLEGTDADHIKIRAFGTTMGEYTLSDGLFVFRSKDRTPLPTYAIDGITVKCDVPEIVRR